MISWSLARFTSWAAQGASETAPPCGTINLTLGTEEACGTRTWRTEFPCWRAARGTPGRSAPGTAPPGGPINLTLGTVEACGTPSWVEFPCWGAARAHLELLHQGPSNLTLGTVSPWSHSTPEIRHKIFIKLCLLNKNWHQMIHEYSPTCVASLTIICCWG